MARAQDRPPIPRSSSGTTPPRQATDPSGPEGFFQTGKDGKDIWLCGGGKLAGALRPEIDVLVVKLHPVFSLQVTAIWRI